MPPSRATDKMILPTMKRFPLLALLVLAAGFGCIRAAEPAPVVQVETSLSGFDLDAALTLNPRPSLRPSASQLPTVSTRSGQFASIERTREIRHAVDFDATGRASSFETSNVGAMVRVKPVVTKAGIQYSGSVLLAAAADYNPKMTEVPTFRASRKWFSGTVRSGEPVIVKTYSPEGMPVQVKITLLLPGADGKPAQATASTARGAPAIISTSPEKKRPGK